MDTVQLNVRIPSDLKAAGDAVFARIGWSTTQAVRALWEFATRHAGDPTAIPDALVEVSDDELHRRQRMVELAHEGQRIVPDFYASQGIPMPEPQPYDRQRYKEDLMEAMSTRRRRCSYDSD